MAPPGSPDWHRRQRARRSRARKRLRKVCDTDFPRATPSLIGLLHRDLQLLKGHHSKPGYSKAEKRIQRMSWNQPWPHNKWPLWPKTPQKTKQKTRGKDNVKALDFPSYDTFSASSSAPASSSAGDLKKAVQWLASSTTTEVPDEIKQILDDGGMQEIKQEQQSLNKRKKLALKLERLKQAKATKVAQWTKYREKMALRLQEEKDKFEKDQADLDKSIAETQHAIDIFGEEEEPASAPDPEMLLQDPEKIQLTKDLEQARQYQKHAMAQMEEMKKQQAHMQQQLQAYAAAVSTNTPPENEMVDPSVAEAREAAKTARQERIRRVEDQMRKDAQRERSPRRESQTDSQDFHTLG